MTILGELNEPAFSEWLATRPKIIQEMIKKWPPNKLYRFKKHRVTIYSYSEGGTVTALVTGEYNLVAFERKVFGVNPAELEECELPSEDEPLGAVLTEDEEIEEHINLFKERMKNEH